MHLWTVFRINTQNLEGLWALKQDQIVKCLGNKKKKGRYRGIHSGSWFCYRNWRWGTGSSANKIIFVPRGHHKTDLSTFCSCKNVHALKRCTNINTTSYRAVSSWNAGQLVGTASEGRPALEMVQTRALAMRTVWERKSAVAGPFTSRKGN